MAIRAITRSVSGNKLKLGLILITSLTLTHCGQDPSFTTKEGTFDDASDSDSTSENGSGSGDSEGMQQSQMEKCADQGIAAGDCFEKYKLVAVDAIQGTPGAVDILWVVDNSGSMSEEQNYLGNNFTSFINALSTSTIDFQLAVTSTDVCQNPMPNALEERRCPTGNSDGQQGAFYGDVGSKILKPSTPDLATKFKNYAKVGLSGSGFEHGLTGAKLGIEKSLSGANEALIRDNAFLAVIVVSDEEDDGIGLSLTDSNTGQNYWTSDMTRYRYTEDDFINYLRSVKNEGQFSVSTIAPTASSLTGLPCWSLHSQPTEIGTQYIKVAQKTGGITQSICEYNWNASLANIGADLNAQITQIVLEDTAADGSIKVYVNDVLNTDWSYISASNAIRFDANKIPAAGAKIHVEYLTLE
jgi:hypothetical protein